jgi:hypothetical protein
MDERERLLGQVLERTERILHILEGNGGPGLVNRVDDLESDRDKVKGLMWVGTGGGLLGVLSAAYHWLTKH